MIDMITRKTRAKIVQCIRSFFIDRGYLEVDTPLLSAFLIPEGHLEVFRTRLESPADSPRDLYLVPSPELWMKRLLAEGSGSIFQICKSFRNREPLSALHNPEFTMLEWYTVGADYLDSVEVLEVLFVSLFRQLGESPIREYRGERLDCSPPFLRLSMDEAFARWLGKPLGELTGCRAMRAAAENRGLVCTEADRWEDLFHKVFLAFVEPRLPRDRAVVLYDYPSRIPTLARRRAGTPWSERWELYLAGVELANCYSEETDPERIEAFFRTQEDLKRQAAVPHPSDRELLRILHRTGLPKCSGVALGLDRLLLVLLGRESLRELIPYSREVYP